MRKNKVLNSYKEAKITSVKMISFLNKGGEQVEVKMAFRVRTVMGDAAGKVKAEVVPERVKGTVEQGKANDSAEQVKERDTIKQGLPAKSIITPDSIYVEGHNAFKSGDILAAREQYQKLIDNFPQHELVAHAYYWIGETYYSEKDYERAIVVFQKVIKNYPKVEKAASAMFKQSLAYKTIYDYKQAKHVLKQLLNKYPESDETEQAKKLFMDISNAEVVATPQKNSNSRSFTDSITGMEFVPVKKGCFQMGDIFGDGDEHEKPVHEVCVSDFSIGKYEVTQGQWKKIMGKNPSEFKKCGNSCPVENVSWDDIQTFIKKLNAKNRKNYRLPTEAEWEYACRGGGREEKYCGGNDLDAVAWYAKNSGGKTHPVGQKQPNGLGIYDMSGNVNEWVNDWFGEYPNNHQQDPQGASSGSDRVLRGGSWYNTAGNTRSSNRLNDSPDNRGNDLGFRLVLPPVQ